MQTIHEDSIVDVAPSPSANPVRVLHESMIRDMKRRARSLFDKFGVDDDDRERTLQIRIPARGMNEDTLQALVEDFNLDDRERKYMRARVLIF